MMPGMSPPPAAPGEPSPGAASPSPVEAMAGAAARAVCPYLIDPGIGIRYARPDRAHRCTAVRPAEPVSSDVQRATCLTATHEACTAFATARSRRAAGLAVSDISLERLERDRRTPFARTAPIVLRGGARTLPGVGRPGSATGTARAAGGTGTAHTPAEEAAASRPLDALPGVPAAARTLSSGRTRPGAGRDATGSAGRGAGASRTRSRVAGAALALVVVAGAAAVVAARLPGLGHAAVAGATGTPAVGASVAAAASVGASAVPQVTPAPPTPSPSVAVTPTPPPATPTPAPATRSYRVRAGDTLSAIAARFGVSVAAIEQLNGIKDPRLLQIGQVLKIP